MRHARVAAAFLLLVISGDPLVSQTRLPEKGVEAIRRALDDGRYAEAERLAVARVVDIQPSNDAAGALRASDLLVEALTKNGKIGDPATVALARRLVLDKAALFGGDSPEVASSLDNLGALYTERGEFADAISLHERALTIRRRSIPSDERDLARTLERLALPLIRLERFSEAQRDLNEASRIREPSSKTAPLDLARSSYLEALLHRWDGHYDAAVSALNGALQTRLAFTPNHPDNVEIFELNGDLLFLKGEVRQAEQQWTDDLSLAEQTLGATHPVVAPLLHRLAIVAQQFGDLTRKRELLERAIRIEPGVQVPCYAELPAILNDFGTLNGYLGDFQQARTFFIEAVARAKRCLGPTHSLTTTMLHNQAVLAADMGDFRRAAELHRQVLGAWSQRLGPNHPYLARSLDSLAEVATAQNRNIEASQLLEKSLSLRTRALGAESPDVASTLVSLARTIAARGNASGALDRVDQAIAIYQRGNRPQDPDSVADALSLRGSLLLKRGDYAHGRDAFAMALSERERVFGAEHPLTAKVLAELASADFALGSVDNAVREALEAEQIGRNHLRFTIRYLPERQALAYADKRPRGLDLALSAVADGRTPDRDSVMDAVVRSRGVILDELGARAHLTAQSPDPVLASLNAAAAAARERFANLMMRSVKGEDPVPRAILDEARTRKEDAERALAERSASARAEVAQANVGLNDVREKLPSNTVLVAFVRYDRTIVAKAATDSAPRTVASYIGFVLRSNAGTVDAVPLGAAARIDSAIAAWRTQIGHGIDPGTVVVDAERAYRTAGTRVRQLVWDPFSSLVGGASQVVVVPDGAINLVSFAALPTGTNRYLVESGPVIHFLSTERDVIGMNSPTQGRGMLAVGGPTYGDRAPVKAPPAALQPGCGTLGAIQFEDLPGSRREATEVANVWSSAADARDVRVLSGRAATKTVVKQAAAGRRVIHLATHGYFLQSPCDTSVAGTRGVGGLASRPVPSREFADNALLLTGLAFAGANLRDNARANRNDDGILTAEEVTGLNLQGTEWVVLSACDTGTGQIKAGEGVFGLRRAFQIAGVRTVIMSLWSVEDESTRIWMRNLYQERFKAGASTADAVRNASVQVLQARRARGESTHPFYWAAFVAAGDWR